MVITKAKNQNKNKLAKLIFSELPFVVSGGCDFINSTL